ncbi:hypothetical protein AMTR_s00046p00065080 [Amborella trichopoda]|uniref:Uncharacterized protein n=1 Tax=Amborella trichopoda TaxID=13333 RepID=U5DC03_AMBTC|nr:hypothetical protein AMTR_s00046p00065080 [Amborella trichopoda]
MKEHKRKRRKRKEQSMKEVKREEESKKRREKKKSTSLPTSPPVGSNTRDRIKILGTKPKYLRKKSWMIYQVLS